MSQPFRPCLIGVPWDRSSSFERGAAEAPPHIRTMTPHLTAQAERFGVEVYGVSRWREAPVEALRGPLYVSIDLDGLDPAFAPGVAHPEPGGLSTRDVIDLLHRIKAPIAGADIVEYNPRHDIRDLTARVAAKLLKELVGVAIRNAA